MKTNTAHLMVLLVYAERITAGVMHSVSCPPAQRSHNNSRTEVFQQRKISLEMEVESGCVVIVSELLHSK